ncbi:MAG: thioredoxin-dependent thiol peroxidase [Acidimicrobiia bacterium]
MLEVGDLAPAFTLPDESGSPVSLSDFAGRNLIIFFYPKAMTPGCTTEACDFRDRADSLLSAGYSVVGVSPDPVDRLQKFREKEALVYPLLSDEDHAVAVAYGAWGTKKNYGREYEGLIRSTFVVGADGNLDRVYRNVRATGHVARVTRDLLDD